jgi:serine/threonine protein kinase
MAPEILFIGNEKIKKYDEKVDIWSAGTIFYSILTGRFFFFFIKIFFFSLPFDTSSYSELEKFD